MEEPIMSKKKNIRFEQITQIIYEIFEPGLIGILGKLSGFQQRLRKISAQAFLLNMVFAAAGHCRYSYSQLGARMEVNQPSGKRRMESLSAAALCKKMTGRCAAFFELVMQNLLTMTVIGTRQVVHQMQRPQWIELFNGVNIIDSTTTELNNKAAKIFGGFGGCGKKAAMKIHLVIDALAGAVKGWRLSEGKQSDDITDSELEVMEPGSLNLMDAGYGVRRNLLSGLAMAGRCFISKFWSCTKLFTYEGKRIDLMKELRKTMLMPGQSASLNVWIEHGRGLVWTRLVVLRLSKQEAAKARRRKNTAACRRGRAMSKRSKFLASYVILITNTTASQLSEEQVQQIYRLRWQVELAFKGIKSFLGMRQIKYTKQEAIRCHVTATAIASLLVSLIHFAAIIRCEGTTGEPSYNKITQLFVRFSDIMLMNLLLYNEWSRRQFQRCIKVICQRGMMDKRNRLTGRQAALALS